MPERTFTASLTIPKSPWDVYEFLADEEQQAQWRDRFAIALPVTDAQPYTRIRLGETLEFEIEPDGDGTLLTLRRTYTSSGTMGRIGLRLFGRGSTEDELTALLRRVEMAVVHDTI